MYERFAQLLIKNKITTYKVSKGTGISQSTFTDWKKGRATPKIDKLQKIADFFNVPIEWLIGNENRTELTSPEKSTNIQTTYNRDEFKDLTQDEVDTLAVLAKTLKEKRKKKEDETVTVAVAARSKNNDEHVKIIKIPKKDSDILDTAPESDEIL